MPEFVRVAAIDDVPVGGAKEVELAGRVVALFNIGGQIHAIEGICPHAGGPLAEGTLEGEVVTCPWHGWQFNVCTGANPLSAKLKQPSYEVKIEGSDILLAKP